MARVAKAALAAGFVVGIFVADGFAQEVFLNNNPSYPLQIVSVSPNIGDGGSAYNGAKVTLRNTGNVACVAFGVSVILHLSNSQTARQSILEDHVALGQALPGSQPIAPGALYEAGNRSFMQTRLPVPKGVTIERIEARVDYVEMADGKTYGADPDALRIGLSARRLAAKAERARLLKIYRDQGIDALVTELTRQ